jgi:sugar lactone lactonase YvrE
VDSVGNVYVADYGNNRIRRITPGGVVTTLAGSLSNTSGSTDGTGTNASFNIPTGVAVDSAGNVYVADFGNHRIRKITPTGVVSTLAGSSQGSTDGTGTNASFNYPHGVAVDSVGNVYVADQVNNRIRRITPEGVVTTLAGSLSNTSGSTDGTGTNASFSAPRGVAVDSVGNVYVADIGNHRIRRITSTGVVTTLAGSLSNSNGSIDGTGTNSQFSNPTGVAVDSAGNVYVADQSNQRIRKITSTGVVTTLVGSSSGSADGTGTNATFSGPTGVAVDSVGNVYVADQINHRIRRIIAKTYSLLPYTTQTGSSAITVPASTTQTLNFAVPSSSLPSTLTLAGTWVLKLYAFLVSSTSSATITCQVFNGTTLLTSGTSSVIVSSMTVQLYPITFIIPTVNIPDYLELDVIVTTQSSPLTFQFTAPNLSLIETSLPITTLKPSSGLMLPLASGTVNFPFVTTLAGSLSNTSGSTDGIGTNASFNIPRGVAVDSAGNVYVADNNNHRIRKIDTGGVVTTLAGSSAGSANGTGTNAGFTFPSGVAVDSAGNVFVADQLNHRIRRITPEGVVTTFAGSTSGSTDGTGTNASFNTPFGVAVDSAGNVFVADTVNNRIRRITSAGVVTTLAGSLSNTSGSTDGTGTNARFNAPQGVAFDSAGNVYVGDTGNNRIRRITSAGVVTTLAGSLSNLTGSANGTGTNATFNAPRGVTVDSAGNVYVADGINHRVRRITSEGVVTTIVGSSAGSVDGIATNASFNTPIGVAIDSAGNLYIGEQDNHRIRKLTNIENSLLPYTPLSGSSAITVSASTTRTVSFAIPASSLPSSLNIAGIWALNLYAFLTSSTSSATITCQLFNGTTLLTSGTTGVTVASMTIQPYSIPFIVPNVNIVDYLRLNVIVTTQSSPITFQFTSPSLSFLQTSLPITTLTPSSGLAFPLGSGTVNFPIVTTFAGSTSGSTNGTGTNAQFNQPAGVAVDSAGNVYVADQSNNRIRKIDTLGVVTTLAGSTQGSTDGTGTNATFNAPYPLAVDSAGNVYVSDRGNNRIRRITPLGVVTTFAGSLSNTPGSTDGTGTNATFSGPFGMGVDSAGNVFIADTGNHRIRRISTSGVVTTFAGSLSNSSGSTDGVGTNATFNQPFGIAFDSSGNMYVTDLANNRIRRITPAGVVTTFAGSSQGSADGTGTNSQFSNPTGVAVDSTGNIYIGDQSNHRIRKLINIENSLLPFTSTGTSAITVPVSTTRTVSFGIPALFLSSFTLAGTWMLTLYASLTTSTSPATITCQLYNGTTLLTSGTTSVTVSSMTAQPYSIPFIVPNVYIPEYLELDVIVTTQSSPVTFHFSSPNMSFLQTSFPLTSQYGNPSVNGTDYAYHQRSTHMFFGQGVTTGAGTIGVYSTESNVTGQGGSVALGARSTDFGGGQQHQIQARIAGVVDGSYTGAFIIQTCANGALPERFRITSAGYVGINCNAPSVPLVVNGYILSNVAQSTYFSYNTGLGTNPNTMGHNTTIFAQTGVVAGAFIAYSDQRIKTDIQDVQDDEALQQLRLIQPKTYTYKDIIEKGSTPVYGFIAQQVRSVLPYSTGLIKNTIPDIYKLGDRVEDIVTLRDSTFSFNESSGNVKFIQKKGGDAIVPVNFISSNQLQILDTSNLDSNESEIFVYGREVEDFHTLNKDAIFTVNVAATQELDRQLQAAKVQIASLETRLALLESQFAASQTPQ